MKNNTLVKTLGIAIVGLALGAGAASADPMGGSGADMVKAGCGGKKGESAKKGKASCGGKKGKASCGGKKAKHSKKGKAACGGKGGCGAK